MVINIDTTTDRFIGERFCIARVIGDSGKSCFGVIDYATDEPTVVARYTSRDEAFLHASGANAKAHRYRRLSERREGR